MTETCHGMKTADYQGFPAKRASNFLTPSVSIPNTRGLMPHESKNVTDRLGEMPFSRFIGFDFFG